MGFYIVLDRPNELSFLPEIFNDSRTHKPVLYATQEKAIREAKAHARLDTPAGTRFLVLEEVAAVERPPAQVTLLNNEPAAA